MTSQQFLPMLLPLVLLGVVMAVLFRFFKDRPVPINGVQLWGAVGAVVVVTIVTVVIAMLAGRHH